METHNNYLNIYEVINLAKRASPTQEEYDRIAETMFNADVQRDIIDAESFDVTYDEYFSEEPEFLNSVAKRRRVFDSMRDGRPDIKQGSVFRRAGGKSFELDRKRTAQTVVTTQKEYLQRGASKVDLKGYDTKSKFDQVGRKKTRIVYGRQTQITIGRSTFPRFRDKSGQFISTKKRKR